MYHLDVGMKEVAALEHQRPAFVDGRWSFALG